MAVRHIGWEIQLPTLQIIMPRLIGGGIKRRCCLTSVCLSLAYIGPKSRTERERHGKTKIGTEVAHVTRDSDTTFKVKRSNIKVTGTGAYCGGLPYCSLLTIKLPVCKRPLIVNGCPQKLNSSFWIILLTDKQTDRRR